MNSIKLFILCQFIFLFLSISFVNADITDGLVGWWKFDEASGNAIDSSGYGNDATETGSTIVSDCKKGLCRSFNGSSDYVRAAAFSWPGGSPITITFWNNSPGGAGQHSAFTIGNQTNATSNIIQAHAPDASNTLYFDYGTNGTGRISLAYTSYLNKWTHIALVNNGVDFKAIYINGKLANSGSTVATPPTARTGIYIGAWQAQNYWHLGSLDDFRVYNRVLTLSEINAIYLSGTSKAVLKGGAKLSGMKMN